MKVLNVTQIFKLLLASFMLVGLFLVVQVSSPQDRLPSAHAAELTCSGQGACIGTVVATVTGGGGGGINVGGSGGGSATPPPVPKTQNPTTGLWWDNYRIRTQWQGALSPFNCPPKTINGAQYSFVGYLIVWKSDLYKFPVFGYGAEYVASSTCIYPQVSSTSANNTCILDYTATIDRLAQSRLGAANGVGSNSGTIASIADLEANGSGNCRNQHNAGLAYNPPNGQDGWGQYRASSRMNQVTCNFVTTTFDGASKETGTCGNPSPVNGSVGQLTIWCDGYAQAWIIKDWTGSDCQNGSNARLSCTIPNPATYNGYATNPQALRDGKDGTVLWGTPQVVGGWGMTNWKSSTVINAGSSPRNNSGDNNDSQQLFKSSIPFGGGMIAGQNLDQKLAFYTAGDSGSPFSMTRNYRYDAWFQSVYTSIRSIDLRSGNISVSTSYQNTFAVDNKCGPQASPRIDVIRAIGDNIK